ncbi:hypothetical protein PAXRUDRAFT_154301 [Paxillus rubicundulus Ve08.2h10]|uniref:Uncharacterized protein n=1 Tax=Paxillus rubicundulus Ve08.2h10 TaxID=930991 RepID=A0A0D0DRB5_9AGAM|nr:hypothetical protein PAXRUDRAFT_154301 [Paxillus rubicundulus Ve08.2h10]
MGGTKPIGRSKNSLPAANGGVVRIQNTTLLIIAIIFSVCFILALSCAFLGDDEDEPYFKSILNEVAQTNPGLVLLGENVDVDIDEPSITIRWSIIGCGDGYVLDGSAGIHESTSCGLPPEYLQIYVDSSFNPTAIFDPSQLPYVSQTGRRRNIQNLVQFDSDHTLDVHEDRLYPFDTYFLTSTIRAIDSSNATVPIRKLTTIDQVSSFLVASTDVASYETTSNGTQLASRDIDLQVQRPGQARAFTLLLFALSWMLTHITFGHVILAKKHQEVKPIFKHLVSSFVIVLAIPQLRNAMPDAPGYDVALTIFQKTDCIGFFPQMILSAFSVLALLLLIILREFDAIDDKPLVIDLKAARPTVGPTEKPSPLNSPLKPLILNTKKRTSSDSFERGEFFECEKRQLGGAYAFPARSPAPSSSTTIHHRSRSSRSISSATTFSGQAGTHGYHMSKSSSLRTVTER